MKHAWLLVVALAAPAHADRAAEDWVGTWTGKAKYDGCTVEGADSVTVTVRWRDGGLWLDGAALYDGLGELAVDARDGALSIDLKDVALSMTRGKKAAKLALTTAAQCKLTAKLTRPSSNLAACDDVVALAAVAASCGVTVDDDPADEVAAWRALKGKQAKRAAKLCGARATALRDQLVDASCLAPEHDPSAVPACDETWALSQRLLRCQRLPAELQKSTLQGVAEFRRSLRALHDRDGADELAASKCAETSEILRDVADAYGCL